MRYLWAILGGAMVGAATALLFAPATGRQTRALIRDKTTKYTHDVEDFVESKSRHWMNKLTGYRHQAAGAMEKGREMIQRARGTMETAQASLQQTVESSGL